MDSLSVCGWIGGIVTGAVIFSPPFLKIVDTFNLTLSSKSELSYNGEPTFFLILEAWFIFAIIFWILVQSLGSLSRFLIPFVLLLFSALFFFSFLPYPIAVILWILVSFIFWYKF